MPRVLRIINRLNLGGPTYNAAYLSAFLPKEYETLLLAGMKDESEESSEYIVNKLGLKPVYISSMKRELNLTEDYQAYWKIRKIIKEFRPDIVHTHAAKSGTLGRLAAAHAGVPVIIHTFHGHVFHSYFGKSKTQFFLSIERYLAKRSSAIIAISNSQKKELVNEFHICKEEKVRVIPLGFDLDRFRLNQNELRNSFRTKYQLDNDTLAIGIIGRLVPIKNHSLFIRSVKQLIGKTTRKFHAFIIGDGEERQRLEELCKSEGISFNNLVTVNANAVVTFTSWIKEIEVALAGLDIVALTSFNEGTPVSLIEAQAAGKPIVSTNVGGISDVILKDQSAFLVPTDDVTAFVEKLAMLIDDDNLRLKFSSVGWPFVQSKFHYRRLVDDMSSLYEELLRNKSR